MDTTVLNQLIYNQYQEIHLNLDIKTHQYTQTQNR